MKFLEDWFWKRLEIFAPSIHAILFKKRLILRYIIAGGTATAVDVSMLYVGKEFLHLKLRPAVATSFLIAFLVSFLLQKFWAFEDNSKHKTHSQAVFYFTVSVTNFF